MWELKIYMGIDFLHDFAVHLFNDTYVKTVGSVWDCVKDPDSARFGKSSIVTNHMEQPMHLTQQQHQADNSTSLQAIVIQSFRNIN